MVTPPSRAMVPASARPMRAAPTTTELNEAAENYRKLGPLAETPAVLRETQRSLLTQLISMAEQFVDPPVVGSMNHLTGRPYTKLQVDRWIRRRAKVDKIIEDLDDGSGVPHTAVTKYDYDEDELGQGYSIFNGKNESRARQENVIDIAKQTRFEDDLDEHRKASDWLDNAIMHARAFLSLVGKWTGDTRLTRDPGDASDAVSRAMRGAQGRVGEIDGAVQADHILPPPPNWKSTEASAEDFAGDSDDGDASDAEDFASGDDG